jgi:NAD dependent epimerase/dehydratase family enzyme
MSWLHDADLLAAVDFLVARRDIDGPVNLAAPNPLPQREFMRALRVAVGMQIGLPATRWMAVIGAFVLRSDSDLLLKSRRVVPGRLLDAGFRFRYPDWPAAATNLVGRSSSRRASS